MSICAMVMLSRITRRKGNADSKDWRFDNDTFIICLRRYYGGLEVEQGNILELKTS